MPSVSLSLCSRRTTSKPPPLKPSDRLQSWPQPKPKPNDRCPRWPLSSPQQMEEATELTTAAAMRATATETIRTIETNQADVGEKKRFFFGSIKMY